MRQNPPPGEESSDRGLPLRYLPCNVRRRVALTHFFPRGGVKMLIYALLADFRSLAGLTAGLGDCFCLKYK